LIKEIRASIQIAGIVQGVGFRPFVCGLARKHDLRGWVLNDEKGVTIEAEGAKNRVHGPISGLSSPPPISTIEKTVIQFLYPLGYPGFVDMSLVRADSPSGLNTTIGYA
jgi:hydrogenase maturation protein HypF